MTPSTPFLFLLFMCVTSDHGAPATNHLSPLSVQSSHTFVLYFKLSIQISLNVFFFCNCANNNNPPCDITTSHSEGQKYSTSHQTSTRVTKYISVQTYLTCFRVEIHCKACKYDVIPLVSGEKKSKLIQYKTFYNELCCVSMEAYI